MSNVNFSVLNALFLIKKQLGEDYQEKGFNPFCDDFVLDVKKVSHLLLVNQQKKLVEAPSFLQEGENHLKKTILFAKKNAQSLLQEILKQNPKDYSERFFDVLAYIKICNKLLGDLSVSNLSFEEILDVWQIICCLDEEMAKIFKKVFEKDFLLQVALKDFLLLCEKEKIKEKPKQIQKQHAMAQRQHKVLVQSAKIKEEEFER